MEARTATPQDLSHVFEHLAVRMSQDYALAGETEGKAKEHLLMDLKEGRGHALVENNETLAVITWHDDRRVAYTSFAADEAFFSARTVRFCKRHILKIQKLCGNAPIRSVSQNRTEVERWFAAIGFTKIDQNENGAIYELPAVVFKDPVD